MIIKFFCCDRCGQVIEGDKTYSLEVFKRMCLTETLFCAGLAIIN